MLMTDYWVSYLQYFSVLQKGYYIILGQSLSLTLSWSRPFQICHISGCEFLGSTLPG